MKSYAVLVVLLILQCSSVKSGNIGDPCETGHKDGFCRHLRDCPDALSIFNQHQILPAICSNFPSKARVFCCLSNGNVVRSRLPDRVSVKKCKEYSKKVYSIDKITCGHTVIELIVGGKKTLEGEFPHMALIGYEKSKTDFDYLCGGSLISEKFVLTAAHCSYSSDYGRAKYVKLGKVARGVQTRNTYKYEIKKSYKHPDYNARTYDNDIALFKLNREVVFNKHVIPICLAYHDENTSDAIATGWGSTGNGGELTRNLLKVQLNIFKQSKCQKSFQTDVTANRNYYDTKICAGHNTLQKDTCNGDSGGPLQIYNLDDIECMYMIVGVTSYGDSNCEAIGSLGVYTRVFKYLKWIEDIVWGNEG